MSIIPSTLRHIINQMGLIYLNLVPFVPLRRRVITKRRRNTTEALTYSVTVLRSEIQLSVGSIIHVGINSTLCHTKHGSVNWCGSTDPPICRAIGVKWGFYAQNIRKLLSYGKKGSVGAYLAPLLSQLSIMWSGRVLFSVVCLMIMANENNTDKI